MSVGQERDLKEPQTEHAVPSSFWLLYPFYKINLSDLMLHFSPTTSIGQ